MTLVRPAVMPWVWVAPFVAVTLTDIGTLNMSTVVVLMKMALPTRANSAQS